MLKLRQGVGVFAMGFAYIGCSAQAEPDYLGEPLATLHGTVVTSDAGPEGDIDAALLWLPEAEEGRSLRLASTRVQGSFPASFTLEVLTPPPSSTNPESGGTRYGIIAAIKHQSGQSVPVTDILGTTGEAIVVYFPNDSQGGNDLVAQEAAAFNVPATRGYHLVRTVVTEESEARFYRCQYEGVCEHQVGQGNELMQAFFDRQFALCTKYLPDAPRCEITPDTDWEHDSCVALVQAREKRLQQRVETEGEAGFCEPAWSHVANPEDLSHPVTVVLGTTYYDALYPSTLSLPGSTE